MITNCRRCERFISCFNRDRCDEDGTLYEDEVCPKERFEVSKVLLDAVRKRREEQEKALSRTNVQSSHEL